MQNPRLQTQKSTAPTELTTRTRADAGSSLSGLVRSTPRYWIGSAALIAGIGAVVSSITLTSTPAGQGLTLGFGAFIALFALLSLLARNQTPSLWGLFVAGFVLFLLPWLGAGFVPDPAAAWTAWVVGFLAMAVGAIGWLSSRPPTVYGINENTSSQTSPALSPIGSVEQHLSLGLAPWCWEPRSCSRRRLQSLSRSGWVASSR
jgi:hypothetical protein